MSRGSGAAGPLAAGLSPLSRVRLHGQETAAFGDAGYRSEDTQGPTWYVVMQPGKRKTLDTTKK